MVHANGEGSKNRFGQMSYHLNKSIVHFMKENEDKIRDVVKASTATSVNISCVHCCKCYLRVVERVFYDFELCHPCCVYI